MNHLLFIPFSLLALAGVVGGATVGLSRSSPGAERPDHYYDNLASHLQRFQAAVHQFQATHDGVPPTPVGSDADGGLIRVLGNELSNFSLPTYNQLSWRLVDLPVELAGVGLCAWSERPISHKLEATFAKAHRELMWEEIGCGVEAFNLGFVVPLAPVPESDAEAGEPSGVTSPLPPPAADQAVSHAPANPPVAAPPGVGRSLPEQAADAAARAALLKAVAGD